MDLEIDLVADLNAEDDEGLGWSVLNEARDPSRVRRGVMLVAGNDQAKAVVRIVAVDEDGQVHFTVLPGSLEKNRHLIGRALAKPPHDVSGEKTASSGAVDGPILIGLGAGQSGRAGHGQPGGRGGVQHVGADGQQGSADRGAGFDRGVRVGCLAERESLADDGTQQTLGREVQARRLSRALCSGVTGPKATRVTSGRVVAGMAAKLPLAMPNPTYRPDPARVPGPASHRPASAPTADRTSTALPPASGTPHVSGADHSANV